MGGKGQGVGRSPVGATGWPGDGCPPGEVRGEDQVPIVPESGVRDQLKTSSFFSASMK